MKLNTSYWHERIGVSCVIIGHYPTAVTRCGTGIWELIAGHPLYLFIPVSLIAGPIVIATMAVWILRGTLKKHLLAWFDPITSSVSRRILRSYSLFFCTLMTLLFLFIMLVLVLGYFR